MPITPLMNLDLPDVGVTPGPQWAQDLNDALYVIDAHDHSAGRGGPISTSGLRVNGDLNMNGFNITNARSYRTQTQVLPLTGPQDRNTFYTVNGDMYYNNAAGTAIQLTLGNSLNATLLGGFVGDYAALGSTAEARYTNAIKLYSFNQAPGVTADIAADNLFLDGDANITGDIFANSLTTIAGVTSGAAIIALTGDITAVTGDINALAGDVRVSVGDVIVDLGGVTTLVGDIVANGGGDITSTTGTVSAGLEMISPRYTSLTGVQTVLVAPDSVVAGTNTLVRAGNAIGADNFGGALSLQGGNAIGTDSVGGPVFITTGQSTGAGASTILFSVSAGGAPGNVLQPAVTRLSLFGDTSAFNSTVIPNVSGAHQLGLATNIWSLVYATNFRAGGDIKTYFYSPTGATNGVDGFGQIFLGAANIAYMPISAPFGAVITAARFRIQGNTIAQISLKARSKSTGLNVAATNVFFYSAAAVGQSIVTVPAFPAYAVGIDEELFMTFQTGGGGNLTVGAIEIDIAVDQIHGARN